MDNVTAKMKKHLMVQAHGLQPVVMIGRHGLTAAVHAEIKTALAAHELIKIKVASHDRHLRTTLFSEITEKHEAALIHKIGLVAIFYRRHEETS